MLVLEDDGGQATLLAGDVQERLERPRRLPSRRPALAAAPHGRALERA